MSFGRNVVESTVHEGLVTMRCTILKRGDLRGAFPPCALYCVCLSPAVGKRAVGDLNRAHRPSVVIVALGARERCRLAVDGAPRPCRHAALPPRVEPLGIEPLGIQRSHERHKAELLGFKYSDRVGKAASC